MFPLSSVMKLGGLPLLSPFRSTRGSCQSDQAGEKNKRLMRAGGSQIKLFIDWWKI
jgi:hypothetical protein